MVGRVSLRLRVGVSGHRHFDDEQDITARVAAALDLVVNLTAVLASSAVTPVVLTVVSSLAEGADRIVARDLLGRAAGRLEAVLPLSQAEYEKDFRDNASLTEFRLLLRQASTRTLTPAQGTRDGAYLEAGLRMLDRVDLLIAIWDGQPGRGVGGTAEIVAEARGRGLPLLWIPTTPGAALVQEVAGLRRSLTSQDLQPLSDDALRELDRYNAGCPSPSTSGVVDIQDIRAAPPAGLLDPLFTPVAAWIQPYYTRADDTARRFQRHYGHLETPLFGLAAGAVVVVAAQIAFRREHPEYAVVELLFIALAFVNLRILRGVHLRERWVTARYLAEWLRTAFFLGMVGVPSRAGLGEGGGPVDIQAEWLRRAFAEIWLERPNVAPVEGNVEALRSILARRWIEDQRHYFANAATRQRRRFKAVSRVTEVLFMVSFLVAILHTTGVGSANQEAWWVLLSISLPVVAAALHAMSDQREYRRHADRYGRTAMRLETLRPRMEAAATLDEVRATALETERLLREEASDWFGVVRLREAELPF